jgi:Protein of unknown function (DUF3179)
MGRSLRVLLLGGVVLVVGGAGVAPKDVSVAAIDGRVAAAMASIGPLAGLGEGDPPAGLTAGWKTDFTRHTVPLSEFQSGGPGKDGIPALDHPRFASAARTSYLRPHEPVIELTVRGSARAYPLQILIWHEIVNDRVRGVPVAVTFCPLCNTAIVFDRGVRGRLLDFGTTGNLRDSDLVMYDRQTESWWQQFGGEGVVGRYAGTRLRLLAARIVSWHVFSVAHPHALVLSQDTGYGRPYGSNPYTGYDDVNSPPSFPVSRLSDNRLPPKERVVFIQRGKAAVAVPLRVLARKRVVRVQVGGHRLIVRLTGTAASALDSQAISAGRAVGTAEVREHGRLVPFSEPFWFAVAAFRPRVVLAR